MKRIAAATCAVGLAFAMTASAQQTTTTQTTQSTSGDAKTISFTGCVGAGTETRTYVLDKVVPVTKTTETVGTAGTTTSTTTSYMLVPGEKVEIQKHVGRKVEVTGMLIPASESKTTTTTTSGAPPAAGSSTTVTEKSTAQRPQFRVMSIRELAEKCD